MVAFDPATGLRVPFYAPDISGGGDYSCVGPAVDTLGLVYLIAYESDHTGPPLLVIASPQGGTPALIPLTGIVLLGTGPQDLFFAPTLRIRP
jgi:hypothetical protein